MLFGCSYFAQVMSAGRVKTKAKTIAVSTHAHTRMGTAQPRSRERLSPAADGWDDGTLIGDCEDTVGLRDVVIDRDRGAE